MPLSEGRVMEIFPKNNKSSFEESRAVPTAYSTLATMNAIAKVVEGHKSVEIKCFKCMAKFDTDWSYQRHVLWMHSRKDAGTSTIDTSLCPLPMDRPRSAP